MNFELDEQQAEWREQARAFARERLAPQAKVRDRQKEFPMDLVKEGGKKGWLGCLVPEAKGGSGLGNVGQAIVLEEIAAVCASTHVTMSVHNSLVCSPIVKYGSDDLQARYLPKVVTGEWLGAYLLTEPGAGSDAASLKTRAEVDGDDYVISGDKMWITTGDVAKIGIVFARTNFEEGVRDSDSISAFVVDFDSEGITFGKREPKMGIRGSSTVAVFLDKVRVPAKNLLGELNRGFHIAMDMLNGGRIGIAIQAIGVARAALDRALEAVSTLERGGKILAKRQLTQFALADIAADIDAARLLAYRAAGMRDAGVNHIREASMAKLFASRIGNDACRRIVALLGEAGYSGDLDVERLMRDVRVAELYEGTTEVQKIVIAKQLRKT